MKVRVVLPSGQIPGILKWPLWSVTVRSFPDRRMTVPSAVRPPAPRTEPSRVCSSHRQVSHSALTCPIAHSREQSGEQSYFQILFFHVSRLNEVSDLFWDTLVHCILFLPPLAQCKVWSVTGRFWSEFGPRPDHRVLDMGSILTRDPRFPECGHHHLFERSRFSIIVINATSF